MKVQEVMTEDVAVCTPEDTLADAAAVMRGRDCGAVPVLGAAGRVVAIITDRDVCLAAARRDRKLSAIKVGDAASPLVADCRPDESLKDVLKKMRKNQVRRLPVTSQNGNLLGIISIADVFRAAERDKSLAKKLVAALEEISKPRPITLQEVTPAVELVNKRSKKKK